MKNLPDNVAQYKTTPEFNQDTIPERIQNDHKTDSGTWGRIVVHEGTLRYVIEAPKNEEFVLEPGTPGIVEPQCAHHVEIIGPVRFCVEFYR